MRRRTKKSPQLDEEVLGAVKCEACKVLEEQVQYLREQNEKLINIALGQPYDTGFDGGESIIDAKVDQESIPGYSSRRQRYAKLTIASRRKLDEINKKEVKAE